MSVGGKGIPRLQDLSYLELAATNVAAGKTFEDIRRALLRQAAETAGDAAGDVGSGGPRTRRDTETSHVHNTVDVLKELMRLGWLDRETLPSGARSAYLHKSKTFTLTESGQLWADLVTNNRRDGYNALVGALLDAHPQFEGFLRVVGARPTSTTDQLTIPQLKWSSVNHQDHGDYLEELIAETTRRMATGKLGWTADPDEVRRDIEDYVTRIKARLTARGLEQGRRRYVNSCDEAVVKVAFAAAGCKLDYISMELLRRWTRFLGIGNFTYHAPDDYGLRFWATAAVTGSGTETAIKRHVGADVRKAALDAVLEFWQWSSATSTAGMYLPIWELRAAVCWRQRISDDEFDKALIECLQGKHPNLGFKIHLDQASARPTPPSTKPLILPTESGHRRVFNVVTVIPTSKEK